jgi:predicted Na+-dependent transporter
LGLNRLAICCAKRTIARGVTTIGASFPGVLLSVLRFSIWHLMIARTCVFGYPRSRGSAAGTTNVQNATHRVHDVQ